MILPMLTALAILQPANPAPAKRAPSTVQTATRSAAPARAKGPARIVVIKSQRELQLLAGDTVLRRYKVGLGLEPVLPKVKQGDYATPEGNYFVCTKNPQSKYDFALGLSYPCPNDAVRGLEQGLISNVEHERIIAAFVNRMAPPWDTPLGGAIMIHGKGSSWDWTEGCIALDHQDIEELFRSVPIGTPVTILP
jgi:murein L,D-transpeptidase YafK